jgi:predicted ester cyclase
VVDISLDENKSVARAVLEALFRGEWAALDDHPGYAETRQHYPRMMAGMSEVDATIVQMVAEGDLVASRATLTVTHSGTWFGVPATGRRVTFDVFTIDQIRDGRVVHHNATADLIRILLQLGALQL